ncbi:sensor histidine kinase [Pseudonocardia dioxanivorans]|uniref:sensor histidine kinase n=1 Tax=Pseudonocardia dioxanivorans TaxID=240495 RepID=UPI000CD07027|nr:GAF domain-containing protein [Pseudonocardia dioxanivorans]
MRYDIGGTGTITSDGARLDVDRARLVEAALAVASGSELEATLHRVVEAATALVDARYGALGVLGADGRVVRVVEVGSGDRDRIRDRDSRATPVAPPAARTFLGVPIRAGDVVFGNLWLTAQDAFTAAHERLVQALAAAAGVAVHNAVLLERARTRERWLEALGDVRGEVLGGATTAEVLTLVATRTVELTASTSAVVLLGPDDDGRYRAVASAGAPPDAPSVMPGVLDEVTESRGPVLGARPPAGAGDPAGPWLAVPMLAGERVEGVLLAVRPADADAFVPAEVPLLTSFAEQAVLALDIAEKARAQRRLDVLADRERIAREVHDRVIQRLFATGLQLQSALRRTTDDDVAGRVRRAVDQLDRTVRDIRASVFDPQPDDGDPGLSRALLDLVARAGAGSGIRVALHTDGPVDTVVGPDLVPHVLAVAREAVANAVRHSGARLVTLTVRAGADLVVRVVDDGMGIRPGAAGDGLADIVARARDLGGTASVERRLGGGTRIVWRVPLDDDLDGDPGGEHSDVPAGPAPVAEGGTSAAAGRAEGPAPAGH